MKNSLLTAAFVLVSTFGFAQDKAATTGMKEQSKMDQAGHTCLMVDAKTMESMNLTADQMTKMEAIQAQCAKECSTMPEGDAKRTMTMEKHMGEIKSLLTEEQFMTYTASHDAMQKEHGEMHHEKGDMMHKEPTKEKK